MKYAFADDKVRSDGIETDCSGVFILKKQKSFVTDFTSGPIASSLLKFAAPLFLASLLQAVYNMVDMIIVGQVMGKVGLSAVSVGGDLVGFLTFLAIGFGNAGQIIISQYLGAKENARLSRFVATMFAFLTVVAIVLSMVFFFLRDLLLKLMSTPPEAYAEAFRYLTVCLCGLVFIYGYNASSAVLRGLGDSKHPFLFIGIASVANVILDIAFVAGLGMGAGGAALATVISQAFSFICCAVLVVRRKDRFGLALQLSDFLKPDRTMLSSLLKLGIPMALKSAAIQTSKLFVNSFINSYGVAVSAFAGIANKINITANMMSNSLNTSGSTMVGQNLGARNYDRIPKIIRTVLLLSLSIGAVLSAILLLFPTQVFNIFTTDPDVIAIGMSYIPIGVLLFFGAALRTPSNALINGSGNYKVNLLCAILDAVVMRIGFAVFFGLALGMKHLGFWLGDALAGYTPFVIFLFFYFSGKWKKSLVDRENE